MSPPPNAILATLLASLRYWQQDLEANEDPPISDHFVDVEPLTSEEIDTLCESLNSAGLVAMIYWTPVTTELPDEETSVLARMQGGEVGEAYRDHGEWYWAGASPPSLPITHWSDLPDGCFVRDESADDIL